MARPSLDKDPELVSSMFDQVAPRYDLANAVLSFGMERAWRVATRKAISLWPGELVLDLAGGTGTSSAELAKEGAKVVCCDFSPGMLAQGQQRQPELSFVAGDGCQLPFKDACFDVVTISYGLRNIADPRLALAEMLRVTKPGGRIVIAEFSTPPFPPFRWVYRAYLRWVLPRVARRVSQANGEAYVYLMESISTWPKQQELGQMLLEAGWEQVAYRNLTGGIVAIHRALRPV